jgi:hypothetical protein
LSWAIEMQIMTRLGIVASSQFAVYFPPVLEAVSAHHQREPEPLT